MKQSLLASALVCILLAQVALELLAWVALVEHGKVLDRTGSEDLGSAENKIRTFLEWAKVDPAVPVGFTELDSFRAAEKLADGLQTLVRYRNKLVHTTHRASFVLALDPLAIDAAGNVLVAGAACVGSPAMSAPTRRSSCMAGI